VRTHRSEDKLRALLLGHHAPMERLSVVVGDYSTAAGAHALASWLADTHPKALDHVVSIHGGKHPRGKLSEVCGGDYKDTMRDKVLSHIIVAQLTLGHVKSTNHASFTIVTGGAGAAAGLVDNALLNIANCATHGVAASLMAEVAAGGSLNFRANEVRVATILCRDGASSHPAFPGEPAYPASRVVANIIAQTALGQKRGAVLLVSDEECQAELAKLDAQESLPARAQPPPVDKPIPAPAEAVLPSAVKGAGRG
jgi:hypothetical protein